MKNLVFTIILLIFASVVGFVSLAQFNENKSKQTTRQLPAILGKPSAEDVSASLIVDNADTPYTVHMFKVADTDALSLFSNLQTVATSSEILNEKACLFLINAGFYSKENVHIGLFVSNYLEIQKEAANTLFNGFLSINDFGVPRITKTKPRDNLRIAVQSGPLLIENGKELVLSLTSDKKARRMIAATTGTNELIFLTISDPNSKFVGPYLTDLPQILTTIQDKTNTPFADAINLDGGTASAFYTDTIKLTEASPLGGYFCLSN